jgi:hypothetical protein
MPCLNNLQCTIELPNLQSQLKEFGTTYGDGIVETYVAVPKEPQKFQVHFKSNGYIAPGLGVFVFIDGKYQCNRNRVDLVPASDGSKKSATNVDFRFRRKEEKQSDGTIIARDWTFEKLNTGEFL